MNVRVLPVEEWPKADAQGNPLHIPLLPREVDVIAVEDDGRVVARMMVMRVTHLEGVWIDPEYRNGGVVGALLRESVRTALRWSDKWVLGGAADDRMRDILERMGGKPWPGEFYVLGLGG